MNQSEYINNNVKQSNPQETEVEKNKGDQGNQLLGSPSISIHCFHSKLHRFSLFSSFGLELQLGHPIRVQLREQLGKSNKVGCEYQALAACLRTSVQLGM